VKKVLYGILFSLTIAMIGLCFRVIPAIGEVTNGEATAVDIYNIPPSSRQTGKMIDLTIDSVLLDGGYDNALDASYFVVPAGIPGKDNVMLMIVMVSDANIRSGLTSLTVNSEAEPVTVKGYFSDIPESNKEQLISGFITGGLSRSEAEEFYKDNILPAMFVESTTVEGITKALGFVLIGATAIMVIITVLLTIRRFKNPGVSDRGFTQPGYIPQGGSPNGYRPPNSGGYAPPKTGNGSYVPPGGYAPPRTGSGGYRPASEQSEPLTDEFGNPFDPTKIKQPDYDDFFGDKKPKTAATKTTAETKKPDAITGFNEVEMEAVSVPVLPNAAVSSGADYFDDFITPPDVSSLEDQSLDSYKPADTDFSFPKTDVPATEHDPISDMDLNEYLSADYLSADFTPDNPDD
jgi:hypothetical protein